VDVAEWVAGEQHAEHECLHHGDQDCEQPGQYDWHTRVHPVELAHHCETLHHQQDDGVHQLEHILAHAGLQGVVEQVAWLYPERHLLQFKTFDVVAQFYFPVGRVKIPGKLGLDEIDQTEWNCGL